jgi:hypothetical protein
MSRVQRFEELKCWQAARALVKEVYLACKEGKLAKDYDTKSQIRRAALASMNNIAEGFGRYVLEDLSYLSTDKIQSLRLKSEETKNLTLGFISYLRKSIAAQS